MEFNKIKKHLLTLVFLPFIIASKLTKTISDFLFTLTNKLKSDNLVMKFLYIIVTLTTFLIWTPFFLAHHIIDKIFYRLANIFEFNSNSLHTVLLISIVLLGLIVSSLPLLNTFILTVIILTCHSINTETTIAYTLFLGTIIPDNWIFSSNPIIKSIATMAFYSTLIFVSIDLCCVRDTTNPKEICTYLPRKDKTTDNIILGLIIATIALPEILSVYAHIILPAYLSKIVLAVLFLSYTASSFRNMSLPTIQSDPQKFAEKRPNLPHATLEANFANLCAAATSCFSSTNTLAN